MRSWSLVALPSAALFGLLTGGMLAGCPNEMEGVKTSAEAIDGVHETPAATDPAAPKVPPKPVVAPAKEEVSVLPAGAHPALLDPSKATETAPATYRAKFETTDGDFVIEVNRDWAPLGADRFYNLVKIGFYDDVSFFRVIDGFMVQFGISGYPDVSARWREANLKDDPKKESNKKGMVSFATAGPNTRTTQVFINFSDNTNLDGMGFTPIGRVVEGMDVVEKLYKGYGEGQPNGMGPDQRKLQTQGTVYLKKEFPELDYVKKATILP